MPAVLQTNLHSVPVGVVAENVVDEGQSPPDLAHLRVRPLRSQTLPARVLTMLTVVGQRCSPMVSSTTSVSSGSQ